MYIKRQPLGRGNLSFRKRKPRYPWFVVILYFAILLAAVYVFFRADQIRPRVTAMFGPTPMPTLSADELVATGEGHYLDGDLDEAIVFYQQAAALDPNNIQVLADLARLHTLNYELDQAIAVADEAIALDPEDPRGYTAKARALDWQGEYEQAVASALQAIEIDPNYALAHAYLAEAYADLGRLIQAQEQAELAINLDPYSVDARRNYAYILEFRGYYAGAIQQYLQALQIHPNLLDLWYGLARNYRGAGQYQESEETYQQIILRTPQDPLPYVELGRTYFEIREDAAAQSYLSDAVALVCEDCPLYTYEELEEMRADNSFDSRELPETIFMPAWSRLANVYYTRRNYEDAIATFEEAIAWGESNGEDVPLEAYYVTGAAYFYLNQCEYAVPRATHALELYEERYRNNPDPAALDNILKIFVLCRDHANPPYALTFPVGYEEPTVVLELPGSEGEGDEADGAGE
jgi:tetratricopeptide (TPR) repeat protein